MKNVIPTDSPSIYDRLTTLERNAIVRPNNPPAGICGFLFDIDFDEILELFSEITDHPAEDNLSLQSNIALLPERVTLRGLVAELTDKGATFPETVTIPNPLPIFPTMFPPFDPQANIAFGNPQRGNTGPFSSEAIARTVVRELAGVLPVSPAIFNAVSAAVNNAVNAVANANSPTPGAISSAVIGNVKNVAGTAVTPDVELLIGQSINASLATTSGANSGPEATSATTAFDYFTNRSALGEPGTLQARAAGYFYQLWRGRMLCSVETPFGILEDMAIQSVRFEQDETTKSSSALTVTFKKFRVARSVTVDLGQLPGRAVFQAQAAAPAQVGNAGQTPATTAQEESWLYQLGGSQKSLQKFFELSPPPIP